MGMLENKRLGDRLRGAFIMQMERASEAEQGTEQTHRIVPMLVN